MGTDLLVNSKELPGLLLRMVIALGIGFLIGLEREYAKRVVDKEEQFAGVRTYPLIGLFGFLAAFLSARYSIVILWVALAGLAALVIASYLRTARAGSYGITTELAGILTFLLGAVVHEGQVLFAIVVTVIITSLLSLKLPLHRFVSTLTPVELRAIIQFVIIAGVVLPFLPDRDFGPKDAWNLHDIWAMVILVSGISLVGYLLLKILGSRKGILLTGVVGGLVSSTAVTLDLARRKLARGAPASILPAVGIIAATCLLYPRILFEAWAVHPELALHMAAPVSFITAVCLLTAFLLYRRSGKDDAEVVQLKNPLNFRVALQFAVIYMAVTWLIAVVMERGSTTGLYATSMLFGTTDMDAITLSIARRSLDPDEAVTAILLATLSNTVLKYAIVFFLGQRTLRKPAGIGFAAVFVAGVIGIGIVRWL